MEDNQITIIDEQGNEILCEVLFTFDSDEFNKSYVLYYPIGEEDEEGNSPLYASSYDKGDEEGGDLVPVETDEEWDMIEEMVATFLEDENMQ
jgi:uncharacterized protein YrzB (UPF0473 family)